MKTKTMLAQAQEKLLDLDHHAHEMFEPYADTLPIKMLDLFSKLGDQPQLRVISAALLVAGVFGGSDRLRRAGARMIVAHEAATLVKKALKHEVDRVRPRSADTRRDKTLRPGRHDAKEWNSFPSGHSAGAIAAARSFSREFPEYGPLALGAAGIIALGQVPRCAHYPTDVAAGVGLGLAVEEAVNAVWNAVIAEEPAPA